MLIFKKINWKVFDMNDYIEDQVKSAYENIKEQINVILNGQK